jgi:hypothetical protein
LSCDYTDSASGAMESPLSTELVTADTVMTFQFRLGLEATFDPP